MSKKLLSEENKHSKLIQDLQVRIINLEEALAEVIEEKDVLEESMELNSKIFIKTLTNLLGNFTEEEITESFLQAQEIVLSSLDDEEETQDTNQSSVIEGLEDLDDNDYYSNEEN